MRHRILVLGLAAVVCLVWLASTAPLGAAPAGREASFTAKTEWDRQFNNKKRFKVLSQFDREAVLDRETGLVWQRSTFDETDTLELAIRGCFNATTGGRMGWRLPTAEELSSLLVDVPPRAALPEKHPFLGIVDAAEPPPRRRYWSCTMGTLGSDGFGAFSVALAEPEITTVALDPANELRPVLCVRGGGSGRSGAL